jgi:hypothetical protein
MAKEKKAESPVERPIFLKQRLIGTLRKEIATVRAQADEQVKKIEFRIKMAQTLVDALTKGKS